MVGNIYNKSFVSRDIVIPVACFQRRYAPYASDADGNTSPVEYEEYTINPLLRRGVVVHSYETPGHAIGENYILEQSYMSNVFRFVVRRFNSGSTHQEPPPPHTHTNTTYKYFVTQANPSRRCRHSSSSIDICPDVEILNDHEPTLLLT